MKKKLINLVVLFCTLGITIILVELVYELRKLGEFSFILGVAPNFIASSLGIFIFFPFVRREEAMKYSFFYSIGLTIYEILQERMLNQTFDPYDIIATWLGFTVSILLLNIVIAIAKKLKIRLYQSC